MYCNIKLVIAKAKLNIENAKSSIDELNLFTFLSLCSFLFPTCHDLVASRSDLFNFWLLVCSVDRLRQLRRVHFEPHFRKLRNKVILFLPQIREPAFQPEYHVSTTFSIKNFFCKISKIKRNNLDILRGLCYYVITTKTKYTNSTPKPCGLALSILLR